MELFKEYPRLVPGILIVVMFGLLLVVILVSNIFKRTNKKKETQKQKCARGRHDFKGVVATIEKLDSGEFVHSVKCVCCGHKNTINLLENIGSSGYEF